MFFLMMVWENEARFLFQRLQWPHDSKDLIIMKIAINYFYWLLTVKSAEDLQAGLFSVCCYVTAMSVLAMSQACLPL